MIQRTQIDLLRHGELETSGLFCAEADEPLSKKGLQDLLDATKDGNWDIIVSSPQKRCKSFAEILASQKDSELLIDPSFKEMDFGRWTGVPIKTLWEKEPSRLKHLWESPETFTAPAGESVKEFTQRVIKGWGILLNNHQHKNILLITHAGVIRAIFTKALEISHQSTLSFNIEYAHLSRLHHYTDGVYSLRFHGVSHAKNGI